MNTSTPRIVLLRLRMLEFLLHVLAPILIGSSVYVFWRVDTLLVFYWIDSLRMGSFVNDARVILEPMRNLLPNWFLYSLPDALWVYAATAFWILVWRGESKHCFRAWTSVGVLVATMSELGQAIRVVPGTFCAVDLTLGLVAWFAALASLRKYCGSTNV